MSDDRAEIQLARVALGWLVEPGSQALWSRVAKLGPVRVLDGLLASDHADSLRRAAGARLDGTDPRRLAEDALARTRRLGARVVIPEDDEWPSRVDDLIKISGSGDGPMDRNAAPPLCLWVRGAWRLDEVLERSVAVVGSRAATAYGSQTARQIGYGLAEKDWCVVSGGAYGVDAYAHRGALAGGGPTVVVLACGIDRPYPVSHAGLFETVAENGLLVSEWPPGAEPFRHRFLIRNRVIAAATAGTVVVEAAARSGSLQTLRRAGELNRCQMAVPGPVTSAMSVGCHEQLRQPGVRLVAGVPHILEEVGRLGTDLAEVPRGPEDVRDRLDPTEHRLVEALFKRKPLPVEEIAVRAGVPLRAAMRTLPALALRGFASRVGPDFVLSPQLASGPSGATTTPAGAEAPDQRRQADQTPEDQDGAAA